MVANFIPDFSFFLMTVWLRTGSFLKFLKIKAYIIYTFHIMINKGTRKGASQFPSGSYECTEFLVIGSFSFFHHYLLFPISKCYCGKYVKIL